MCNELRHIMSRSRLGESSEYLKCYCFCLQFKLIYLFKEESFV